MQNELELRMRKKIRSRRPIKAPTGAFIPSKPFRMIVHITVLIMPLIVVAESIVVFWWPRRAPGVRAECKSRAGK